MTDVRPFEPQPQTLQNPQQPGVTELERDTLDREREREIG